MEISQDSQIISSSKSDQKSHRGTYHLGSSNVGNGIPWKTEPWVPCMHRSEGEGKLIITSGDRPSGQSVTDNRQCDEGKPACERCKKREQSCPGYRNPEDRKFIRMKARDKHASAPSTSSRPSSEAPDFQQQAFETTSSSQRSASPIIPPHQNFCDQAVCFFFHQFVIKSSDGANPGFLDCLPELYDSGNSDDALAHSVKAISYIALSGKSSINVLFVRGHEHYRTTLKKISQMLESPEETVQDSLIVAIILVVLFENLTREKPAVMMNHAKGLHTLLLHRGEEQFSSVHGWAIFRHVNAQTQIRNIELSEHPNPEILHWLKRLDVSNPTTTAITEKCRISQIRARAAIALSLPPGIENIEVKLLEILREARNLDSEIEEWSQSLRNYCSYQSWRLDSNGVAEKATMSSDTDLEYRENSPSRSNSTNQHILTYANVWFASLWNGHCTSRLMLNETIVQLSRRLGFHPPLQSAIGILQRICAQACASIPFSLGDVQVRIDQMGIEHLEINIDSRTRQGAAAGAYFVVWSLRHVVSCEFANESQVSMASEALMRIGAQFGVQQAFTLANRAYVCHPNAVGSRIE